ncbi:hypothetical protein [Aeromicrobium sp. UC242_57]|uniref:hypothetical protein n=1 Tax=Aeromicrobium sp. UC242_57 TaxID=3374624 RepID=UPI00379157A6
MNFDALKKFLIVVGILGFVGLHGYFLLKIVRADGVTADLSGVAVGIGATLTGVLGAAFAVAMGVKEIAGNNRGMDAFRAGPTNEQILTVGVWTYALVGLASTLVYVFNSDETPGSISSLALVFVGYVAAVISNAYKGALSTP